VKYCVIIQPPAAAEMDEAYVGIAERAPESATKWFNGLEDAIYSLEDFPQRCPVAEESKAFDVEIRQLVYGKRVGAYRILFTIVGDAVHVLHVRRPKKTNAPWQRRFVNGSEFDFECS
jgi:plasmid stabilization system protein ParE